MRVENIRYFIGCGVPVYACNFRCKYCYLGQRPNPYTGGILPFAKSPEHISKFFSIEKMGGPCYFNFCAAGETLMHPELIELVSLLTKQGHYADIITNGSLSNKFDELIEKLDMYQRKHLMIKFSFHYLELKRMNLLDRYVQNVYKMRDAGFSYSIEITPHDELVPYIEEIKEFSLLHFGAYPHITVARNEATEDIELLTKMSREEYQKTWSVFDSEMFDFKFSIFSQKRCEFCYAGLWSLQLLLDTGEYYQCYGGDLLGTIKNVDDPIHFRPIGKCRQPHCFNGHAYLTYGNIPSLNSPTYAMMRDREIISGGAWLQPEARNFFSTKLIDSHEELTEKEKIHVMKYSNANRALCTVKRKILHIPLKIKTIKNKKGSDIVGE